MPIILVVCPVRHYMLAKDNRYRFQYLNINYYSNIQMLKSRYQLSKGLDRYYLNKIQFQCILVKKLQERTKLSSE